MISQATPQRQLNGKLANEYCNVLLPLRVLQSAAGFYLGTIGPDGPCSRESVEYFPTRERADAALASGDWTQRDEP